jgi:hypothetical protein
MEEMVWILVDSRGMQIFPEPDNLLKILGERSVKRSRNSTLWANKYQEPKYKI